MKKFKDLSRDKKIGAVIIVALMSILLVLAVIDIRNEDNWTKQLRCGDKVYNFSRDDPTTLEDICPQAFPELRYGTVDDIINTTVEDLLLEND